MATANVHFRGHTLRPPRRASASAQANMRRRGRDTPSIELSKPQDIVHCLLFIIEYCNSADPRWREHKRHLNLFFSRDGGLHLLLMLLNAYYNKPAAGRRPGWVFSGLRERIQISERGLRMLINDAMAEGLIIQLPISEELDRRCRSYRLTPPVIGAWEALTETLRKSIGDVLEHFDAGALANADYRTWDADTPARDQIEKLPPSHRLRRRA
jgi:hypothetical protein